MFAIAAAAVLIFFALNWSKKEEGVPIVASESRSDDKQNNAGAWVLLFAMIFLLLLSPFLGVIANLPK